MRTGIADLPLHYGKCPPWLFEKMKKLGKVITEIIVYEYGRDEFLKRISDPFFFQSFSCVLGFDWHSSGVTTTVTGALKEANLKEFGIAVLGGKGKVSRKTPREIEELSEIFPLSTRRIEELKYASKMSAKVDNTAVQDGFQLYHHAFIVSEDGKWSVIQQGMNDEKSYARRYHWLSDAIRSFVVEPHVAICCDIIGKTLNMVAKESEEARKCSVDLVKDNPIHLKKHFVSPETSTKLFKFLHLPKEHTIELQNYKPLMFAHEIQPKNYEELLAIKGIGPKSIRALALLSNLIFGAEPSWRDPVKFSFAHGGKDGHPYFVDRKTYDKSIEILTDGIKQAKLNNRERLDALKRLDFSFSR